jgi:hypothetical protein
LSLFFRQIQHLLPTGEAWRTTTDKLLRRFFEGLSVVGEDAKQFLDLVYLDLFPATTRQLAEWERFYGLVPTTSATEQARRQALAAEWRSTGGQSVGYIQGVLQTAGFEIWIHEWWEGANEAPRTPRDPRDYLTYSLAGSMQCGEDFAECGDPDAQCDLFQLLGGTGYWDNLSLSPIAPPVIPADPAKWPYFMYFAGEVFPEPAAIPAGRTAELRRLIQKLKPAQHWVVLIGEEGIEALLTEDDEPLLTEDGFPLYA